jgi:hypothetical protein
MLKSDTAMTIEIIGGEHPTHQENLIYDVMCFTCPRVSEENGDYLPGPSELADITQDLTLKKAQEIASQHEGEYGRDHQIIIRTFDVGRIEEALGI